MTANPIQIVEDDFYNSGYMDIIGSCDEKECYKFATKFLQRARELDSDSDLIKPEIYIRFGKISFYS